MEILTLTRGQIVINASEIGLQKSNGTYSHAERRVLFVGDYIDREPKVNKTFEIVKAMVDSNNVACIA